MNWYPGPIFSVKWSGTCPSFTLFCPCIENLKFESEGFSTMWLSLRKDKLTYRCILEVSCSRPHIYLLRVVAYLCRFAILSQNNDNINLFPVKGTRDNFKNHVNFMKPTFLCRLRQDETYDKKKNMSSCATFRDITRWKSWNWTNCRCFSNKTVKKGRIQQWQFL